MLTASQGYRMTLATAALAPAYNPGSWGTFFTLTGTAAATLTGLFFLAFSLRVGELQLSPVLRMRARYLLTWLIAITISSGFVVMPDQSRAALAAEILVVSAGCAAYTAWSVLRTARAVPTGVRGAARDRPGGRSGLEPGQDGSRAAPGQLPDGR